jgi:hypothetical protein
MASRRGWRSSRRLFDTLGEKAGDIVGQISAVSIRLGQLLDDRNLQHLSRTMDNLALHPKVCATCL